MNPQRELTSLLAPIHEQARATARRLCASWADGDDLFQEAVIRALEKLPTLRDRERFPQWFYAIVLSLHRNRWRRRFWRRFSSLDDGRLAAEPVGEDGGMWEEARERSRRMARALAVLPAVQREAVVLFDVSGFSLDETAAFQDVPVATVKSRLFRGRRKLRRHYRALGFGAAPRERASEEAELSVRGVAQ
jgi:RNA polymerase sigma-70 factor (ECF subfamily)